MDQKGPQASDPWSNFIYDFDENSQCFHFQLNQVNNYQISVKIQAQVFPLNILNADNDAVQNKVLGAESSVTKRKTPLTNQSSEFNQKQFHSERPEWQKQESQSELTQKKCKQLKQNIYSKNYRQRKKQQFKILEEQNGFLKKKIQQLQLRLREAQMQLNRVKHNLPQQKKSLIELNYIWLQKIRQLLQSQSSDQDQLYKQFADSYDIYGFAGKQKTDKLEYYMTEFLQTVLKDSQKYMALTVINNSGLLNQTPDRQYPEINYTVYELMDYDQVKLETIKKFMGPFLKPSMEKIQKACKNLYLDFKKVIKEVYQTHEYLKGSRNKDFFTIKQRLLMENWFQTHKYTKQLRKLRADWFDSLKQEEPKQKRERKKKDKYINI